MSNPRLLAPGRTRVLNLDIISNYGKRHADHRWPRSCPCQGHHRSCKAAIEAGIQVPYYCYHPGLGIDASCRVCLVKIEKMPKLQTSCSTPVAEGMVVHTQDARGRRRPQGRVRVPADQSPARLPGVRQGRRVPAAGLLVRVRQRRQPHGLPAPDVRRRGREGRRRLRPDADAEPQPLHPVHALQPVHGAKSTATRRSAPSIAATAARSRPSTSRASTRCCRAT